MFLVNKNFMKRQMYCCSFSERGIVMISLSNWYVVVHLVMHLTSATCVYVGIIYSVFMNLQKKHGGSSGLSKSVTQVQWCFKATCQETKPSDTICKNNWYMYCLVLAGQRLCAHERCGAFICVWWNHQTHAQGLCPQSM